MLRQRNWPTRARRVCCLQGQVAQISSGATRHLDRVSDHVSSPGAGLQFQRFWSAPTMEPDQVMATLRSLKAEQSGDVLLMQALSRRFLANAEEYYPPQIDDILRSFAELSYSDAALLQGFTGRLVDLIVDPSPRRVVRVLQNGAALRLQAQDWLPHMLPPLERHIPNLREGLPSVLESLSTLQATGPELAELLLIQGSLQEDSLGIGFWTRVFERWSRHHLRHSESEERAKALALDDGLAGKLELRDALNLLAALKRCEGSGEAVAALEATLKAKLANAKVDALVVALRWMRRLSLHSSVLWQMCVDVVEQMVSAAAPNNAFFRELAPEALCSLAWTMRDSGQEVEVKTLMALIKSPSVEIFLMRYKASQVLELLQAVCIAMVLSTKSGVEGELLKSLVNQVSRLARQLTLPERRTLKVLLEILEDLNSKADLQLSDQLRPLHDLPFIPLPALRPSEAHGDSWIEVEAGPVMLMQEKMAQSTNEVTWFLTPSDLFAGAFCKELKQCITPATFLTLLAVEHTGWKVHLRLSAFEKGLHASEVQALDSASRPNAVTKKVVTDKKRGCRTRRSNLHTTKAK